MFLKSADKAVEEHISPYPPEKKYCGKNGREKAIQLRELASNSIGSSNRSLTFELQQTIRLIHSVQDEINELDSQIKMVVVELDTPLMTVPGIGYIIAVIILAEIGDINNFSSPSKFLAFAGTEPSTYQSRKYNASNTPMVKRGSSYLRWAIIQAARLVPMRDFNLCCIYEKK